MSGPAIAAGAVRAVLFDFGGVVTAPLPHLLAAASAAAGVDVGVVVASVHDVYARGHDGDHPVHRAERGEIPFTDTLPHLARFPGSAAVLDPASPTFFGHWLSFDDRVLAAATDLRRRGIATVLVSNMIAEWADRFPHRRFESVFDHCIWSFEVGRRKPDPAIYDHALAAAGGVPRHAAVLLDDTASTIDRARASGLRAIHVTDAAAALAELDELVQRSRGRDPR